MSEWIILEMTIRIGLLSLVQKTKAKRAKLGASSLRRQHIWFSRNVLQNSIAVPFYKKEGKKTR